VNDLKKIKRSLHYVVVQSLCHTATRALKAQVPEKAFYLFILWRWCLLAGLRLCQNDKKGWIYWQRCKV
jgi:hypothetical protein